MNIRVMKLKSMNLKKVVKDIVKLDTKKRIKFIFLFGSVAAKKNTPLSDIDIAIYYHASAAERYKFKFKAASMLSSSIDVKIFQDLPILLQKEVIAGKLVYCADYDTMYDSCFAVIKEFNRFEKYYEEYMSALRKEAEV